MPDRIGEKMGYTPVNYVKNCEMPGRFFEYTKNWLLKENVMDEDFTEEELFDYFMSEQFFTKGGHIPKKFEPLFYNLLTDPDTLKRMFGIDAFKNDFSKVDFFSKIGTSVATEWKDLFLNGIVLDNWAKNKQVYKIDPDFAEILLRTEKLTISKDVIDHLPTDLFYLDLEGCEDFYPALGAWINIYHKDDFMHMHTIILRDDTDGKGQLMFTMYDIIRYNDEKEAELDINILPERSEMVTSPLNDMYKGIAVNFDYRPTSSDLRRKDVVILIFQLLNYITSDKPDLEENPITKNTYKPTTKVKNKFSEVQQWDVGVRYGKVIHAYKEKIKKQVSEKDSNSSDK